MNTTQDIVAKLWNLCHVLRDDGITYHQYITELTFLLFLKMGQETDREGELPKGYRWGDLTGTEGVDQLEFYRRMLVHLGSHGSQRVQHIFANAQTSLRQPRNLAKLVENIDSLDWYDALGEGLGDLYEGLLEKNANEMKRGAGQYFTPRPLIESIISLVQPKEGESIQDPAAGTGGFIPQEQVDSLNKSILAKASTTEDDEPEVSFFELNSEDRASVVHETLFGLGELNWDEAVKEAASCLREDGLVEYQRLRTNGKVYVAVYQAIEDGLEYGWFDQPEDRLVRAILTDPKEYEALDWFVPLMMVLQDGSPMDEDDAIRAAAEYAREHAGLEFERMPSGGVIDRGIREAVGQLLEEGMIRRTRGGELERVEHPDDV